jgi:hypothetical protein
MWLVPEKFYTLKENSVKSCVVRRKTIPYKSLKRKDKQKALIAFNDQSFKPLSSWNEREIFGSPNGPA